MGKLTGVKIAQTRIYDDPQHPETSSFQIVLPITHGDAVLLDERGTTLSASLSLIISQLSRLMANSSGIDNVKGIAPTYASLPPATNYHANDYFIVANDEMQGGATTLYKVRADAWEFEQELVLESDSGAGGMIFTELDDVQLMTGKLNNKGAGWQTFKFPPSESGVQVIFDELPHVILQTEDDNTIVNVRNITKEGFQYQVRRLAAGSYTNGSTSEVTRYVAATSGGAVNTAQNIVQSVTLPTVTFNNAITTADPVAVHWTAISRKY